MGESIIRFRLRLGVYGPKIEISVHFRSVCLMHISVTFELTGDTCALVLVGVAHEFGSVSHGSKE